MTNHPDPWTKLRADRTLPAMENDRALRVLRDRTAAAEFARGRLDDTVPGEWDFTLELIATPNPLATDASCSFKSRLQILGVIREGIGTADNYKLAARDAFLSAAAMFGIPCTVDGDTAETFDVPPVPLGS